MAKSLKMFQDFSPDLSAQKIENLLTAQVEGSPLSLQPFLYPVLPFQQFQIDRPFHQHAYKYKKIVRV